MASDPPFGSLIELQPGEFIDRYQVLYPIARGGMGTVWLARIRSSNGFEKHFVLKTVRAELSHDDSMRTMFLDEIKITSAISHGNVAQVIDAGEARDMLYLVMEHIQGESLARIAKAYGKHSGSSLLPPAAVARILVGACAGLHAAHSLTGSDGASLQVVHRDVSPQNLIVSIHGATKVIDFGIATAKERLAQDTSLGMLKGKLRFMAPEQIAKKKTDRRTDIWALGCVMQLLLTGNGPFDENSEAAMLHRILGGQRTPLPSGVPMPLARVVDKCLQNAPERRPENADVLGQMLEDAMRQAGLVSSESDIARLFAPIFKASSEHASTAMKTALSAIEDRERVRQLLEPRKEQHSILSSSSIADFGSANIIAHSPGATPVDPTLMGLGLPDRRDVDGEIQARAAKALYESSEASTATGVTQAHRAEVQSHARKTKLALAAVGFLGLSVLVFITQALHKPDTASQRRLASPAVSVSTVLDVLQPGNANQRDVSLLRADTTTETDAGSPESLSEAGTVPTPLAGRGIKSETTAKPRLQASALPKPPGPIKPLRPQPGASEPDFSRRY